MIEFDCILLLAGSSQRAGLGYNKVFYKVNDKPLYYYSLVKFLAFPNMNNLIIVCKKEEEKEIKDYVNSVTTDKRIMYVAGGDTRGASVYNGMLHVASEYVLIHDGARPLISKKDIQNVVNGLEVSKSVALVSEVTESVRRVTGNRNRIVERKNLVLMKTPQGLKTDIFLKSLEKARKENLQFTDDVSVLEFYYNSSPLLIDSTVNNIKVTNKNDLELVKSIIAPSGGYLVGQSRDTHRLTSGDAITIGGVKIPCEFSIVAHSDGDALYHAIAEAIIGALAKGDIGTHFPDTSSEYKDISSSHFMQEVYKMMDEAGYEIVNLDSTIYIEKPMMRPHINDMVDNIANLLKTEDFRINVKATRGEKVGDIGQSKAFVCEAIVLLKKKND